MKVIKWKKKRVNIRRSILDADINRPDKDLLNIKDDDYLINDLDRARDNLNRSVF